MDNRIENKLVGYCFTILYDYQTVYDCSWQVADFFSIAIHNDEILPKDCGEIILTLDRLFKLLVNFKETKILERINEIIEKPEKTQIEIDLIYEILNHILSVHDTVCALVNTLNQQYVIFIETKKPFRMSNEQEIDIRIRTIIKATQTAHSYYVPVYEHCKSQLVDKAFSEESSIGIILITFGVTIFSFGTLVSFLTFFPELLMGGVSILTIIGLAIFKKIKIKSPPQQKLLVVQEHVQEQQKANKLLHTIVGANLVFVSVLFIIALPIAVAATYGFFLASCSIISLILVKWAAPIQNKLKAFFLATSLTFSPAILILGTCLLIIRQACYFSENIIEKITSQNVDRLIELENLGKKKDKE